MGLAIPRPADFFLLHAAASQIQYPFHRAPHSWGASEFITCTWEMGLRKLKAFAFCHRGSGEGKVRKCQSKLVHRIEEEEIAHRKYPKLELGVEELIFGIERKRERKKD